MLTTHKFLIVIILIVNIIFWCQAVRLDDIEKAVVERNCTEVIK